MSFSHGCTLENSVDRSDCVAGDNKTISAVNAQMMRGSRRGGEQRMKVVVIAVICCQIEKKCHLP